MPDPAIPDVLKNKEHGWTLFARLGENSEWVWVGGLGVPLHFY